MHDLFKGLFEWYTSQLADGGYLLVALLMAIESSIVPLPSEAIIPPAVIVAQYPQAQPLLGMWDQLVAAGRAAFTAGMQSALAIAGATALVAAIVVAVLAPAQVTRQVD